MFDDAYIRLLIVIGKRDATKIWKPSHVSDEATEGAVKVPDAGVISANTTRISCCESFGSQGD
jgi:hypothetical protein